MLVSWAAFPWKLMASVGGQWECLASHWSVPDMCWKSRYPMETPSLFGFISREGAVRGPSCSLHACPSTILSSTSFHFLLSILLLQLPSQSQPSGLSSSVYLYSFSRTPLFSPTSLAASQPCPWAPRPSSQPCSRFLPKPFGQGTPLSPSETWCRDCLSLMSASPHHLGKEGKIHKRDGKYISFSFYSTLF